MVDLLRSIRTKYRVFIIVQLDSDSDLESTKQLFKPLTEFQRDSGTCEEESKFSDQALKPPILEDHRVMFCASPAGKEAMIR